MSKAIESKIADLIAQDLAMAGYDLVRVALTGGGKYAGLQIMAERQDGVGMKVEDCATISKMIAAKFETDKDLADRYDLEVSSPGIDRPLVRLRDFARFQGHVAKIELNEAVEGQKRFEGKIAQVAGEVIEFTTGKGPVRVTFDAIGKAKLVMTDELLKAAAQGKMSH